MTITSPMNLVNVGSGTAQNSASSATIAAVVNSNTLINDLVVMVAYVTGADVMSAVDAGDGWTILDRGYTGAFGILIAAVRSQRSINDTWLGITLPGAGAYIANTNSYRLALAAAQNQPHPSFKFCPELGIGSTGWFNAAASSTALGGPAIQQNYAQGLDFVGRGYNNAGSATTVANITNFTELFESEVTAGPQMEVVLNLWNKLATTSAGNWDGFVNRPSVTSALGVAKTNRAGVRCFIPIIGDTMAQYRNRFMVGRRIA